MSVQIAYRMHADQWILMSSFIINPRMAAVEYALVIDGQRTFRNVSFDKVKIVADRVNHTSKLLELSIIA